MAFRASFKVYYRLAKPGIVYSNVLTAAAGFLLAAGRHVAVWHLIGVCLGIACLIASACMINNVTDRKIDKAMARTRKRALVTGRVQPGTALLLAAGLGMVAVALLIWSSHWLTLLVALFGYLVYIGPYALGKRRSVHGTFIGAFSGAVPIVAGYTAVSDHLNTAALLLGVALICWQMAHFYGIALYRLADYTAAGLPLWPIKRGIASTKIIALSCISLFWLSILALAAFKDISWLVALLLSAACAYWLMRSLWLVNHKDNQLWGKTVFLTSLLVICAFSVLLIGNAWL